MGIEIKINDEPVSVDTTSIKTLADLIENIANKRLDPSELIVNLYINEEMIDSKAMSSIGKKPLSEVNKLAITTIKNPVAHTMELLEKMNEYLDRLVNGLEGVADKFRTGKVGEANSLLVQAIDGLISLTELLKVVKKVSKSETSELIINGEKLASKEQNLLDVLKQLKDGQENKDWVAVADLLEYELAPAMDEWKETIKFFIKKLEKDDNL